MPQQGFMISSCFMDTRTLEEKRKLRGWDDDSERNWEVRSTSMPNQLLGVGMRLQKRRESFGMTQKELARRMDRAGHPAWRPAKVSKVEGGHQRITLYEAWALSIIFGCYVDDFLPPVQLTPGLHPPRPADLT